MIKKEIPMNRGFWLSIGIIISILFFACDEDATEPENGDNLNKQNFMEITIGENKFEPPSDGADDEYDYLYSVENTVIDLANNTSGIQVDMVMSLTEPPSGIVGEEPELSIYPYELSGQLLIQERDLILILVVI
jgi:hypothetical protein